MKVSSRKMFFLVAISLILGFSYVSSAAFAEEENAVAAKEDTTAAEGNAGVEEESTTAVSGVDATELEPEAENTTAASGEYTTELETSQFTRP